MGHGLPFKFARFFKPQGPVQVLDYLVYLFRLRTSFSATFGSRGDDVSGNPGHEVKIPSENLTHLTQKKLAQERMIIVRKTKKNLVFLQSAISLKIRLVLISASAIVNHVMLQYGIGNQTPSFIVSRPLAPRVLGFRVQYMYRQYK